MNTRFYLRLFAFVLAGALASCISAGSPDLYGSANSARATANAALQQAQLQEMFLTGTAQAPIVHITETAAAMAIQATQAQSTSVAAIQTQVGAMTATAIWWTPTPNLDSTATVAALNAQSTAIANQAIRDNLQLEREIKNNEWNRLAGSLALVFAAGLILILVNHFLRRNRYQAAKVDARGNVIPILDITDGVFTDIDSSPNHQGPMSNNTLKRWIDRKLQLPPLLPPVTAERQDPVKHRDQLLDLATRGLPANATTESRKKAMVGDMLGRLESGRPKVQLISPEQARPILMDVMPQIAQDSIEAELYEEKTHAPVRSAGEEEGTL